MLTNNGFVWTWHVFFLLLLKIKSSRCVLCNYYDTFTNQIRTTYCPQACCLTASNLQDACCYNWTWILAVITVGLPLFVGLIVVIIVYVFIKKKRSSIGFPAGVIMYVDPLRNDSFVSTPQIYHPMPPPHYNEQHLTNERSSIQTLSLNPAHLPFEPPSYNSAINSPASPKVVIKTEHRKSNASKTKSKSKKANENDKTDITDLTDNPSKNESNSEKSLSDDKKDNHQVSKD